MFTCGRRNLAAQGATLPGFALLFFCVIIVFDNDIKFNKILP